jgi:cation:H+ antiporter
VRWLSDQPLWADALVFAVSAAAIWWAGTRLERYADRISEHTGLGQAFTGMMLLATATSLPELATTITAVAVLDNPTLAVHNLLGGVAMQTGLIAVADIAKGRRGALTFFSPRYALLIEGVGLLMLLQLVLAGVTAGGRPALLSVSLWSVLILAAYLAVMYGVHRYRGQPRWTPSRMDDLPEEVRAQFVDADAPGERRTDEASRKALRRSWLLFAAMSAVVLIGGWFATHSAEALAERTGIGSAFMGATLLAVATSLPEVSTTIAAARGQRYTVAISNVFGSNLFDISLLLLADALYRDGAIIAHAEPSVAFVGAIGAIMTCVFLWGLMERENRTVLGIGWDSAIALGVYLGGMAVLYAIT